MQNQIPVTLDNILPAKAIPKQYPHLYSEKSWKWAVSNRQHNGLSKAFRKVGKQLFVNTQILAECIEEQIAD